MSLHELIRNADQGEPAAARELFAGLYQELHNLAESHIRRGGSELTLGATTLLHEAYLRLAEREGPRFPDRARFLAYASKAMRGLIVDYVRARQAHKRGGLFEITAIGDTDPASPGDDDRARIELLNQALEELGVLDPALAQLVDLHFFCGFSFVEIAAFRQVNDRTVQRDWRKAKMVLGRILADDA
jgi:RNA polymerase sigma factor (TIGR02999 family)